MNRVYCNLPYAPLWRRLCAIVYDTLIILALLLAVSMLYHGIVNQLILGYETAPRGYNPFLASILFIAVFLFYSLSWRRSGQTLGMLAWKIRVQNSDGSRISWGQCLLRFMVGIPALGLAGIGMWWMLLNAQRKTWHDFYSDSEVVRLTCP